MVKVSIVIPIYNVEEYLEECLESAVNQTLKEIEVICVNDGSTDNSLEIAERYAEKDARVKIIDKPNSGYGHTMNQGFGKAIGEYIAILESDDYIDPKMCEELYELAVKQNLDFIKADFNRFTVGEDGELELFFERVAQNFTSYYNRVINPKDEKTVFRFRMNTWSGIYKKDFIEKYAINHNESPGASYQDNGFFFKTFCNAERIMFKDKAYYMNRRDNVNSSVHNKEKVYCMSEEYDYIKDYLVKNKLWETFKDVYFVKRLHSEEFTLNRIDDEFKEEYIYYLSSKHKTALQSGEIDDINLKVTKSKRDDKFYKSEYRLYCRIAYVPEEFLGKQIYDVSVILPVYNVEEYIEQCVKSILQQSCKNIELIIVDDGSTDKSIDIVEEIASVDDRVKILKQENKGAGAARNYGLREAKGKYLSFLDADDFFDNYMLEKAFKRCEKDDLDFVVFKSQHYNNQTGEYSDIGYSVRTSMLPDRDAFNFKDIKQDIFKVFVGWAWDKLYRRVFVLENNLTFQEQKSTNDMLFVFSAVVDAQRIGVMDDILAYHRKNVAGSISVTREKTWKCFYNALVALKSHMIETGVYDSVEQDFINYSLHFSLWNLDTIGEEVFPTLYDFLKDEAFIELGISDKIFKYFYNRHEFSKSRYILAHEHTEYSKYKDSINEYRFNMPTEKQQLRKMAFGYIKNYWKISRNFDKKYYMENYSSHFRDGSKINPKMHFYFRGVYYGFNPSENFDVSTYVSKNPEIIDTKENALTHYIKNKKGQRAKKPRAKKPQGK